MIVGGWVSDREHYNWTCSTMKPNPSNTQTNLTYYCVASEITRTIH